MAVRQFRECRLCHRVGYGQYVAAGSEADIWECSNDRACNKRRAARTAHEARVGELAEAINQARLSWHVGAYVSDVGRRENEHIARRLLSVGPRLDGRRAR